MHTMLGFSKWNYMVDNLNNELVILNPFTWKTLNHLTFIFIIYRWFFLINNRRFYLAFMHFFQYRWLGILNSIYKFTTSNIIINNYYFQNIFIYNVYTSIRECAWQNVILKVRYWQKQFGISFVEKWGGDY